MQVQQTEARWKEEAAFFDRVADKQLSQVRPIDPLALERYGTPFPRKRFREEFRFRLLGDLRGKNVLDVGCGEGQNAVMLAKLGAQVTGIDISPTSIEVARKKAEINALTEAAQFVCSPLEEAEVPTHTFDIIWGDAILHHLIENLHPVLERLTLWAKPGGLMVFSEPMNFNNTLRRLRLKVPVKTDATPDERPLEPAEIEILKRFLPDLHVRFFSLFARLQRFVLIHSNYERSPWTRRAIADALVCCDYPLLSLPMIRNMGGYAVLYGHTPNNQFHGART